MMFKQRSFGLGRNAPLGATKLLLILLLFFIGVQTSTAQTDFECEDPEIPNATATYYIGLGDAAFARGDYGLAANLYTCGLEIDPDFVQVYIDRGYAYAALAAYNLALDDFEQALAIDEARVSIYTNRGAMYTQQGNFGLALTDLNLAVSLDPNNAVAFNNRGVVHAAEGNFDLAMADFEQAIALDPNYAMPHAGMAAVYSALAAERYQRFIEIEGRRAELPAGTPERVIRLVDDSLRTGNFAVWLNLLSPDR